jgi:maltose 6'-phosphate phosphatase
MPRSIYFFCLAFISILLSCTKAENANLFLEFTSTVNDLEVILDGTATDADGIIDYIEIDWGDGKKNELRNISFDKFNIKHTYSNYGLYIISATVYNLDVASYTKAISVNLKAEEPSLENIKPELFKASDKEYLFLTLNLHTYQESNQEDKFNKIVNVIGEMDIDFIAFQECAQHRNSAVVNDNIREDNMALIIANKLKEKYGFEYNLVWDWAHYGWNEWEEGIAVLSKYPLIDTDQKYITSNTSPTDIRTRKAIYGSYQTPDGKINVFSTHNHWRTSENDQEHNWQFRYLKFMVEDKEETFPDAASFVCGDFNVTPTSGHPWSEGYFIMMEDDDYTDTFLEIYPNANDLPPNRIYSTIPGVSDGRIDYIFMRNNPRMRVMDAQIIFTPEIVGLVSDHFGLIIKVLVED